MSKEKPPLAAALDMPAFTGVHKATQMPVRAVAHLPENVDLAGMAAASFGGNRNSKYCGELVCDERGIPLGVIVRPKTAHHLHKIDRHWIPASACLAITVERPQE
jgi:hypothetical protein